MHSAVLYMTLNQIYLRYIQNQPTRQRCRNEHDQLRNEVVFFRKENNHTIRHYSTRN